MTGAPGIGLATLAPEPADQSDPTTPSDLVIVAWCAAHFGAPFSEIGVRSRLPAEADLNDPDMLGQAMAAVGLKSVQTHSSLAKVDPIVLPCIVFLTDGAPLLITKLDQRLGTVEWRDPAKSDGPETGRIGALSRRLKRGAMLIAPDDGLEGMDPDTSAARAGGHWFWAPVKAHWGSWTQVLIASLMLNLLALALPLFIMNVYDKVIPNLSFVTLWTLALGVGLAVGGDLVLRTLRLSIVETLGQRIDLKVGSTIYRHALDLRLIERPGGAAGLAARIRDYETVRDFFASSTFVAFFDLLFIVIFLGVLYAIVGPLALLPTAAIPVVLIIALISRAAIGRTAEQAVRLSSDRQTVLMESLHGVETIKTLNAEPLMQRAWETAIAATARVTGRARFWANFATNTTIFLQQAVSVGIIVWGVFLIFDGTITIGALIAASILSSRAMAPLSAISQATFRLQYIVKSIRALNAVMDMNVERPPVLRSALAVKQASLELVDVTYTYPDVEVPALNAISLSISPGENVALLGRVGSGKTTLGKVISGLIQPQTGVVRIDGFGLNQYDRSELREGIGYLPQRCDLFTGTLRENLMMGALDADQQRIEAALYYSGLDEFVASNSAGLDMEIRENGSRLSGGQAQALALARVLLKSPKLLFLDEPTNAMDQEMERRVTARLKELNDGGTTLILCTHRQSLAAIAGRFVILDKGRKILDGTQEAVMERLQSGVKTTPSGAS